MEEKNITYDSFELLYLYVENVRCFESQGFSFTTEYDIKYNPNDRSLSITENHDNDHLKGFFGPNISNNNVIVGKNGSGKTSVLEIIGNNELEIEDIIDENSSKNIYFMIFKTNNNHLYIEGFNNCIDSIEYTKTNKTTHYNFSETQNSENDIINDYKKYYSFVIDITKHEIKENDNTNSNIIIFDKKSSKNLIFTRGLSRLKRTYTQDIEKYYYSNMFKILSSNHQFTNLLFADFFNTNIGLSLNISNLSFEEDVILQAFLNICNLNITETKYYIALILTSQFFTRSNYYLTETSYLINDTTKNVINDSEKAKEHLSHLKKHSNKFLYNNDIIVSFEKDYKTFQYNTNDFNTIIKLLDDIIASLKSIISNPASYSIDTFNELTQIQNIFNNILNNLIFCFANNPELSNMIEILKNILQKNISNIKILQSNMTYLNIILNNLNKITYSEIGNIEITNQSDFLLFLKNIIKPSLSQYNQNINTDNTTQCFLKLIKQLLKLNNISCQSNEILFNSKTKNQDDAYQLLKTIDDLNYSFKKPIFKLDLSHNISKGELQLLEEITNLFNILKSTSNRTSIILLDEPDKSMHPDWSSKFIDCLITMTQDIGDNRKFQFIITTHSPFMLSDIPKEYITTIDIETDKETGNHIRKVEKAKNSFASNYYDLINDSFFLDSTLGHYAERKIKEIFDIIKNTMIEKPTKFKINQTFSDIQLSYHNDFIAIINMIKKDIEIKEIFNTYQNLFSIKILTDIINNTDKNKNSKEILNTLKTSGIYLSIDHDYLYKKLYKIIDIIDEPFIKESLKKELNNHYRTLNEEKYIDTEIKMLEQKIYALKKLKIKTQGDQNDKVR